MAIRDLIEQIAAGWNSYHQKIRVDKNDPIFSLVESQFPEALLPHLSTYDNVKLEGSTGAGNITAAPWIAAFDRRLTISATTGYYVVYLFSVDMSTVTLALAFGTTQFEKQFGGPAKAFPRMRAAAFRLQEMFGHLIPPYLSRRPINLGATTSEKLHYAYQQSAILSYNPYLIGDLPQESNLVADLQELVHIYTEIVSDPLEATVDRLVEAVADPAVEPQSIQVLDFVPRERKDFRTSENRRRTARRYSPESRKVGDAGERVVLIQEQDRWTRAGRPDLAARVRWHPPDQEYPGWDITSFADDGDEIYIEVKSSVGKTISSVNLTVNEWLAASDQVRKDRYYLYLVTNALSSSPTIERMRNPASYVEAGHLSCDAIVFELGLTLESGLRDGVARQSTTEGVNKPLPEKAAKAGL